MTFTVDVGSTACRSLAIFSGPAKAQLVVNKTKSASPTSRVPQAAPFDRRTAVDFCFLCPWRTIKILLTSIQNKANNLNRSNFVPGLVCSRYANVEEWATPSKHET